MEVSEERPDPIASPTQHSIYESIIVEPGDSLPLRAETQTAREGNDWRRQVPATTPSTSDVENSTDSGFSYTVPLISVGRLGTEG